MATETGWRISDGTDGDVSIIADAMEGTAPNLSRGDEITLSFLFFEGGRYDAEAGMAYGGEHGGAYGGPRGGSYGVSTALGEQVVATEFTGVGRYQSLRSFLEYAGTARTGTTLDGIPYYRESVPGVASVESHVLAFEPLADIAGLSGVWGVVVGGDDPSRNPPAMYELTVDVFVLGDRDEFESRSEVSEELEAKL